MGLWKRWYCNWKLEKEGGGGKSDSTINHDK